MFRQYTRYFRGFSTLKRFVAFCIALTCMTIAIHFWFPSKWLAFNNCDGVNLNRNVQGNSDLSEEALNKLKRQWLAEYMEEVNKVADEPPNNNVKLQSYSNLECLINDDYSIQCLQDNDDNNKIYMPFDFIEKYFEITGKLKYYDGYNRFEFSQSYSKVCFII